MRIGKAAPDMTMATLTTPRLLLRERRHEDIRAYLEMDGES